MPSIPVLQDQKTHVLIGHMSLFLLFLFLPQFVLPLIKSNTFPSHAQNWILFHNSGNTFEKRIWTSPSSLVCMDIHNGQSLKVPVPASGGAERLCCPHLLQKHLSQWTILWQGHSALDNDVMILLSPYEYIQPAPTLCCCHYWDIKDQMTMREDAEYNN